jgi:hypothetical protein
MRTVGIGLCLLLAAGAPPGKTVHRKAAAVRAPEVSGRLQVASWASLDDDAKSTARLLVGRDSVITIEPNGSEHVTVFGKKRDHREQDWRGDLGAAAPTYEASNSAAAQSGYTSYPEWSSPQEMQTMSGIKDFLGLCHFPLTCPGGNQ